MRFWSLYRPGQPLLPSERAALTCFALVICAFSALVLVRSAFLNERHTDLEVYLRAAWAVRNGKNPYVVVDSHGWHYQYPPLLAVLLVPLADPPPGASRAGCPPFALSVVVWIGLSVAATLWATHILASALSRQLDPPHAGWQRGDRRWWALRLFPLYLALPALGSTLSRGQVNLLLLALLAGMIAASMRGHAFRAGLWLAGAICLKVFPALLLIVPLWQRDRQFLAGCAAGLAVGFVLIPGLALGPEGMVSAYQEWLGDLVLPGLGLGTSATRQAELLETTATDNQSLQALLHNWAWWGTPAADQPRQLAHWTRAAHWLLVAFLVMGSLWATPGSRGDPAAQACRWMLLMVVMLVASPVCHLHYFALVLPLFSLLLAQAWQTHPPPRLPWGLAVILVLQLVLSTLPRLPGFEPLRLAGSATFAALLVWGWACFKHPPPKLAAEAAPAPPSTTSA